jgi:hypothetical protein
MLLLNGVEIRRRWWDFASRRTGYSTAEQLYHSAKSKFDVWYIMN